MIPGSVVHALHLYYRAQCQTPRGRFHRQLVHITLQWQRGGASDDSSLVSVDSFLRLPIPFIDGEFDGTGKEAFPQRLEQPKAWRSFGVARFTNLLFSLLSFLFTTVADKVAEPSSLAAEESSTAHSSW